MRFALDHNNINVLKLEKSIAFYKEAQGLSASREINAADGSFKIVFLSDAAGAHALELTLLRDRTQPYNLGENEFHLAVRTSNKANLLVKFLLRAFCAQPCRRHLPAINNRGNLLLFAIKKFLNRFRRFILSPSFPLDSQKMSASKFKVGTTNLKSD